MSKNEMQQPIFCAAKHCGNDSASMQNNEDSGSIRANGCSAPVPANTYYAPVHANEHSAPTQTNGYSVPTQTNDYFARKQANDPAASIQVIGHRVERAIIMAAGIGQRMQPLTLTTPKPLVTVNGKRMIDTVIEGLLANGITEIYVVTGYLKEKFDELLLDYPSIRLIENPYYETCNNISSLYMVRDHLENAIILDGDQIVFNPDILKPEFIRSGYNAIWTNKPTNEWLMQVENGIVTSCNRTGGKQGWQLFSVSRWSAEDGKKLKSHLEEEFEVRMNRQIYWDDVAMFCHPQAYELGIWEMKEGDLLEIDNLEELAAADSSYQYLLNEKKVMEEQA